MGKKRHLSHCNKQCAGMLASSVQRSSQQWCNANGSHMPAAHRPHALQVKGIIPWQRQSVWGSRQWQSLDGCQVQPQHTMEDSPVHGLPQLLQAAKLIPGCRF